MAILRGQVIVRSITTAHINKNARLGRKAILK
jgi:hypothetical protein